MGQTDVPYETGMTMSRFNGGYTGRVLSIDLSKARVTKKPLSKKLVKNYIGGRGFTSRIEYDEAGPNVDPLSPENPLIFATGPLTGTFAPGVGRLVIAARSPLTGILGDSNVGGRWAAGLKFAGYDMLIFRGTAKKPVYVWIDDEHVEIRDASHVWNRGTHETVEIIKKELGNERISVASIGQAGENLVKIACVMVDIGHAAGKTGMGAVMGSKKLKAVAVRGTNDIKIAEPRKFIKAVDRVRELLNEDPIIRHYIKFGTPTWLVIISEKGSLPTRNFQTGIFEGAEKIVGEALRKYHVKSRACFSCPIGCIRCPKITDGEFAGTFNEGIEYLTLVRFGPQCGNSNLESIIKMNDLCDDFGLDTNSMGGVMSFAMECYEKKILKRENTDGIDIKWGNYKAMIELVSKIALRKGIGDILGRGSREAAKIIGKGADRYALHIKGLEHPTEDSRIHQRYNVRYLTASRGGDHERGYAPFIGWKMDEEAWPARRVAEQLIVCERDCCLCDMMGACKFPYVVYISSIENAKERRMELINMYSAATGIKLSKSEFNKLADGLINLERAYDTRLGISRKDDRFPNRFIEEPMPEGPGKGQVNRVADEVLDEYYKLRGWNSDGVPPQNLYSD